MPMRDSERAQSLRTARAYREAGYAVTTHTMGLRLHPLTIRSSASSASKAGLPDPLRGMRLVFASSKRTQLQIEAAVIICLAGPLAQRHQDPGSWRLEMGEPDRRR